MTGWTRDSSLRGRNFGRAEPGGAWGDASPVSVIAEGIVAGTPIATAKSWRPVEDIVAGDLVLTFDAGLQPVTAVRHAEIQCDPQSFPRSLWPLLIPELALGNRGPVLVLPEQPVMIDSDSAEELYGDPFALVPALALEGYRGIEREVPRPRTQVVTLCFETEQLVYGHGNVMLRCPRGRSRQGSIVEDMLRHPEGSTPVALPLIEARQLVACMIAEDCGSALRPTAGDQIRACA